MNRKLKIILWSAVLVSIGYGLYRFKLDWYDRYIWPVLPVAEMQELPPEDRSAWPAVPVPWSSEIQAVEVATPEGLKVRDVAYHSNSLGMDFVRIEPGSFRPVAGFRSHPDKWPLRRASRWRQQKQEPLITISRPYYLAAFEVTNLQFEQFDPSHKDRRPEYQRGTAGDYHPVQPVTWREAQQYARWLSQREGRLYRLPTEAEWEYAAMAGTTSRLYWGDAFWDRSMANLGGLHSSPESYAEDGYEETAPVGSFPANPWGLYDMVGNAYEWVQDWWHPSETGDVTDPQGPTGEERLRLNREKGWFARHFTLYSGNDGLGGRFRMAKGGSWTTRTYAIYTGEDDGNNPADLHDLRGFRLLVEIPEQ
jgi:formylglycine-generating enzyme required for sulfatase activity